MGATFGAGTSYHSGESEFTPRFSVGFVALKCSRDKPVYWIPYLSTLDNWISWFRSKIIL